MTEKPPAERRIALLAVGRRGYAAIELDAASRVLAESGGDPEAGSRSGTATTPRPLDAGVLTARELEVIRLVAEGCTNREIAERLVISDKTAARHLHNILTKLGLPNRAAATAFAYEHHLQ